MKARSLLNIGNSCKGEIKSLSSLQSKYPFMARFTCAHIKKDNTIYGNKCCDPTGCYRHWKLYEKNIEKKPCLVSGCRYHTDNDSGCCSKHFVKFYALKYRMRQKYRVDALQLR